MTVQQIEQTFAWIKERNAVPVDTGLLRRLKLSRARLSQLTTSGQIESRRMERTVYVPQSEIDRLKVVPKVGAPRGKRKK